MLTAHLPVVSIVTPSYNQCHYLEQMLYSVRQQYYPGIEHIIIDGGSTDGTLELLQATESDVIWISEQDNGQAEAINKGFARAKGEIFCWLNCDDLYTPGAIWAVVDYFLAHREAMLLYGDALAIDASNRSYGLRFNVKQCTYEMLVQRGDFIVQPAAFWRASLWQEIGPLNESLHYALDYEYWMRAARRYKLHYIPLCLAQERLHQDAKTASGHLKRINELYHVAQQYGGAGIPYHFRAEAAAIHYWQALQELWGLKWSNFWHHVQIGLNLRPPLPKFLLYLCSVIVFGYQSAITLRLWANRFRSWRKPIYPADVVRKPHLTTEMVANEKT